KFHREMATDIDNSSSVFKICGVEIQIVGLDQPESVSIVHSSLEIQGLETSRCSNVTIFRDKILHIFGDKIL
ncbi:hypothetical protein PENTCL1PPCAC_23704, partial [Pristionchus entomophagus]